MPDLSLALVLHRSQSGQAIRWGNGLLPSEHERLLMRLNGYTPLGELIQAQEVAEQMLGIAAELLDHGLVQVVEATTFTPQPTGWGDLLPGITH